MKQEITVIGSAILDVLAGPADEKVFQKGSWPMEYVKLGFGGDALNEAVALSRLEKRVELVSKVGEDEAGGRVLDFLKKNGVSTEKVKVEAGLETGVNVVLVDGKGERCFLTNPRGSLRRLAEADVMLRLADAAEIVSFASIFVSPLLDIPALERIFRKVKSVPGRILAADVTKAKNGETLWDLKPLLPYLDVLFANEEELALLTGRPDLCENAALALELGLPCIAVKRGREGCLIRTRDVSCAIPAYPVEKAVDTTGAGDCFAAGFLWGLSEKMSLGDCGRFGCAAASCAVEHPGATDGIVSLEEVRRRYAALLKG